MRNGSRTEDVMTRIYLGRHVLGLAAILFGVVTLAWHDFNTWQQIRALGNVPHREILVYIAAAIELLGGLTIQWTRTARAGAIALGSIFFVFCVALGTAHRCGTTSV